MADKSVTTMGDEIARYVTERNCALANMDMEWAEKQMPTVSDPIVREIAMHKARYDCPGVEDYLRHESRIWLKERGYKRLDNLEFLPEGELP